MERGTVLIVDRRPLIDPGAAYSSADDMGSDNWAGRFGLEAQGKHIELGAANFDHGSEYL